jgi:hypothetical protein
MFVNPTNKSLEIYKGTRLGIIHKFAKIVYFLIDASKMATALVIATTMFIEPLSQAPRDVILGPRYQYISLSLPAFSNQIVVMGVEFTFTPKMKTELIYDPSLFVVSNRAIFD